MMYPTHMLTSFTGVVALSQVTDLPIGLAMTAGVLLGSVLPDIDQPSSLIGKRTSIKISKKKNGKEKVTRIGLSTLVNKLFGHRGFTHSIAATALLSLLLYIWLNPFVIGLVLGYAFHIVGDMLSKQGVPLLSPLTKTRFKIHLYTTNKFSEKVIFAISLVALIYMGDNSIIHWFSWK